MVIYSQYEVLYYALKLNFGSKEPLHVNFCLNFLSFCSMTYTQCGIVATKLPWALQRTEKWADSDRPLWGKIFWFFLEFFCWFFSISWDGNLKACLSWRVWTCGCGTAGGAAGGREDAITLLQLHNFWAKLPDTLPAWAVRGGSE